jgi:hypothetical protein
MAGRDIPDPPLTRSSVDPWSRSTDAKVYYPNQGDFVNQAP